MCRGYVPSNRARVLDDKSFLKDESLKTLRTCSSSSSLSTQEPAAHHQGKSCLKVKTQTESLHRKISTCTSDKKVFFSTIEIRTYPLRLGDNPSTSSGPPLTISWDPEGAPRSFEVDDYEETRPTRRSEDSLKVSKLVRQEWLREEGYSRGEMTEAQTEVLRIQRGRLASAKESLGLSESKDYIKRKFKKYILHAPSDKQLYQQWKEQQCPHERQR